MRNPPHDHGLHTGFWTRWRALILGALAFSALLLVLDGHPLLAQDAGTTPTGQTVPGGDIFLPIVARNEPSHRVYDAIPVDRNANPPCQPSERPAAENADLNLSLRGYAPTDAPLTLIDVGGPTDSDAPQAPGLFADRRLPAFTAAYQVYGWDWSCGPDGCRGELLTTWPVTLLEMAATPGEAISIPSRNAEVYGGGYKALVLYATRDQLTLAYTRHDTAACGYLVHLEDIAVESSLVTLYNELNAAGRTRLPALRNDEPVGWVNGVSFKLAVRDTGQFMDPRARKDWWQGY